MVATVVHVLPSMDDWNCPPALVDASPACTYQRTRVSASSDSGPMSMPMTYCPTADTPVSTLPSNADAALGALPVTTPCAMVSIGGPYRWMRSSVDSASVTHTTWE